MNILIPDSWLREFLKTDATPKEIKEYLSLCGPSVERMNSVGREIVYDIEVTTNRVDSYSVMGIAREAAAILPRFGKKAKFTNHIAKPIVYPKTPLGMHIEDPKGYCRRILAVKIANITLGASPAWLVKKLELVGQRPLNNIVDITNYVMWETGHPSHAFDYDRLLAKKILVREAKKGEKVVSLDEKKHVMIGGELIFDDGTGTIIDIPGIMGTANTIVTPETKNVLLFIENSDPAKIRFASMTHAIRTQAAVINEKDPDPELALVAMNRAVELARDLTHGKVGSALYDAYPKKFTPYGVSVSRSKLDSYIGTPLKDNDVQDILTTLGFEAKCTKNEVIVTVPSFRRDITLDVDIIEEVARLYGYHNIETHLPQREPPVVTPRPELRWEEEVKTRLRDWGYTETYTYSMISEEEMDMFGLDKTKAYRVANPLSAEWVYMRPSLWPSLLACVKENLNHSRDLKLFELSMTYHYRKNDLPQEKSILMIVLTGHKFYKGKGVAQTIFKLFGIPFPHGIPKADAGIRKWSGKTQLALDHFGSVSEVSPEFLSTLGINTPVTVVELYFDELVKNAKPIRVYEPIPKFPPAVEDMAFTVGYNFSVGLLIDACKRVSPLVHDVTLLDAHENTRTIHITYLDPKRNLTALDIRPIREKIIHVAGTIFHAALKTA